MAQIVDPIAAIEQTWQNAPSFSNLADENVGTWLSNIRRGCEIRGIPRQQWVDVALHSLSGGVKDVLVGMKRLVQKIGQLAWKWESFEIGLARICGSCYWYLPVINNANGSLINGSRGSQSQ